MSNKKSAVPQTKDNNVDKSTDVSDQASGKKVDSPEQGGKPNQGGSGNRSRKSGKTGRKAGKRGASGKKDNPGGKRDDDQVKRPTCINDIGWYNKYPSIVAGSSSHIFNAILGHKYAPVTITDTGTTHYRAARQAIPGVVSLLWTPFYSMKGTEIDAVNVASKNLYTYIRHANSGSVNYESSDLMQYVLCVAELFAYAAQLKRDLRLIFTFKTTNRYLYQRVLWASGYAMNDISDMIKYYALYSNELNILIAQLNTFKIPKDMSFLLRHVWLAERVWKDDELDKATTFIYNMQGIYSYNWADSELEFKPLLGTLSSTLPFEDRLAALSGEINNLLACEDIGIMLGDILKAYGNDACYMCSPLLQGEVYEAEYSKEVTHQIRNAVVLGGSYVTKIKQMPNNSQLLYETQSDVAPDVRPLGDTTSTPTRMPMSNGRFYFPMQMVGNSTSCFAYKNQQFKYRPYLTIESDSPTNEEIILNTRLMYEIGTTTWHTSINHIPYDAVVGYVDEAGTEVITSSLIVALEDSKGSTGYTEEVNGGALTTIVEPNDINSLVHILSQAYKVDDCPQRIVIAGQSGNSVYYISTFYYGKNVITVEADWLNLLHRGCKMSQFTMPMFKLLEARK